MLLAALVDAGAPLVTVLTAVNAVAPEPIEITSAQVRRGGLRATKVDVRPVPEEQPHRGWREIQALLAHADLSVQVRDRAARSGCSSWNQASLGNGAMGCSGVPVRLCRANPPGAARIRSACPLARLSAHVRTGVKGEPSRSSPIRVCIAELNETARTFLPESAATPATVLMTASRMSRGSC